jgi:hypothetical protein
MDNAHNDIKDDIFEDYGWVYDEIVYARIYRNYSINVSMQIRGGLMTPDARSRMEIYFANKEH